MQVSCHPHQERPSVLTITIDGAPWRDVHISIFGRNPTLPQGCISLEDFKEQFILIEQRQAKNYALRRLSMQAMLSTALIRSLKERLISSSTIQQVIQELVELEFLNDEEWSASFARTQKARKMGPRAIAQKLAFKGIKGEVLEQVLEESRDPEEQKQLVFELLKTRYARRNLSDYKEKQKVVASLVRRGFDLSIIFSCLGNKASDEDLEWDHGEDDCKVRKDNGPENFFCY